MPVRSRKRTRNMEVIKLAGKIFEVAGFVICLIGMYLSRKNKDTDGLICHLGLLLNFTILLVHY